MYRVKKELEKIIHSLEGNVLAIGMEDVSLLQTLEENHNITKCNLLNVISVNSKDKKKVRKKRNFHIKNLRKKFHKKKVDYIICNMKDVYPYMNTFIKDSVYINRKKLYFYGETKKYQLDNIVKKYKKYHAKVEQKLEENYFLIVVFNETSKTNKGKDLWFRICDFFQFLYDFIGDLLIN